VGEWESGRVGEWESGRVGEWESGRVGEWEPWSWVLLLSLSRVPALAEAQTAIALAPDSVPTQAALADALAALGRDDEARSAYARALDLARSVEPRFQEGWISGLEQRFAEL
jgi:tetratricopeptide (TPR) repeat protein